GSSASPRRAPSSRCRPAPPPARPRDSRVDSIAAPAEVPVQDVERVAELAGGEGVLVQEAGGPGLLRPADVRVVAGPRVDDDVLLGVERADQPRRLDAVAAG